MAGKRKRVDTTQEQAHNDDQSELALVPAAKRAKATAASDQDNDKPLPAWLKAGVVIGNVHEDLDKMGRWISKEMIERLKRSLGITQLFAVQVKVLPAIAAGQRDVCVCAPTGSGKTLAYAIPIVDKLSRRVVPRTRALVLLPSRDLALQVHAAS